MKKQEFKKMRRGLGIFKATKHSKIGIIGVPEGEKEEQEIENLFEKNNERKFLQYDEGNTHKSSGITESSKQIGPKEGHTETHHNYITQD